MQSRVLGKAGHYLQVQPCHWMGIFFKKSFQKAFCGRQIKEQLQRSLLSRSHCNFTNLQITWPYSSAGQRQLFSSCSGHSFLPTVPLSLGHLGAGRESPNMSQQRTSH